MAVDKSSIQGFPEGGLLQVGKVTKVYFKRPNADGSGFYRHYVGEVVDGVFVPYPDEAAAVSATEEKAPAKAKKATKTTKATKAEKAEKPTKAEKAEKADKAEKAVKADKPAKKAGKAKVETKADVKAEVNAEEKPAEKPAEKAAEKVEKKAAPKKVIPIVKPVEPLPVFKKWDDEIVNQLLDGGHIEEAANLVMNGNPSVVSRGLMEIYRYFSEHSLWSQIINKRFGTLGSNVMGVASYYLNYSWRTLGDFSPFRAIVPGSMAPLSTLAARLEKIRKEKVTKRDRVGRDYIAQVFHGETVDAGLRTDPFFAALFDITKQSSLTAYTRLQDQLPVAGTDAIAEVMEQLLTWGPVLKGANPLLTLDAKGYSLGEAIALGKNSIRSLTFLAAGDLAATDVQALIDEAAPKIKAELARCRGHYTSVTVPLNDPSKIQAHILVTSDEATRDRIAKEFDQGLRAFEALSPYARIESDWRKFFVLDTSGNIVSRRTELIETYRRQAGHWVLLTNGVPDAQLAVGLYSFAFDQQAVITGFCRAAYTQLQRNPILDDAEALFAMMNTMVSFAVFMHNSLEKKVAGTELFRQMSLFDAFRWMMGYVLMRHEDGTFFNMVGPEGKRFLKALGLEAKDRVSD